MFTDLVAKKTPGGLLARVLGKKRPKPGEQAQIPPAPTDADLWAKAAYEQDPLTKLAQQQQAMMNAIRAAGSDYDAAKNAIAANAPQVQAAQFAAANPPARMPTESDKDAAKRRSIAEMRRRRGRASTILTEDTLGA